MVVVNNNDCIGSYWILRIVSVINFELNLLIYLRKNNSVVYIWYIVCMKNGDRRCCKCTFIKCDFLLVVRVILVLNRC